MVREVVRQRVGVAEAAVAGGAASAVELLHQAHLFVRSGSISGNWNMIFHFFATQYGKISTVVKNPKSLEDRQLKKPLLI